MKTKTLKRFSHAAFTLVELLTVIAIIGGLAAMSIPVLASMKKHQNISAAKADMAVIIAALENYKLKYNTYPPSNPQLPSGPLVSGLFYELSGTTNSAGTIFTLDRSSQMPATSINTFFGVTGFLNSDNAAKSSGEDAHYAQSFISNLRPGQTKDYTTSGGTVRLLVSSVLGPDANYKPLGQADLNPFRYVYPGTNNPNSYDLWVDLVMGGKTNRVANWGPQ